MIDKLGFKTEYYFKETQIPVIPFTKTHFEEQIRKRVTPAILELESGDLINGFYFLMHQHIDLRLSSDSWDEKQAKIENILAEKGIPPKLRHYKGLRSDDFKNLDDNNLELNSRLMIAYLLIRDSAVAEEQKTFEQQVPFRWVHYLYNQFGYLNLHQAMFEFESALFQLAEALRSGQCNVFGAIEILNRVRTSVESRIAELKQQTTERT